MTVVMLCLVVWYNLMERGFKICTTLYSILVCVCARGTSQGFSLNASSSHPNFYSQLFNSASSVLQLFLLLFVYFIFDWLFLVTGSALHTLILQPLFFIYPHGFQDQNQSFIYIIYLFVNGSSYFAKLHFFISCIINIL